MSSEQSVTVIGLGPMGQAMARAYLARGYEVTVWNRTASRADDLVAHGAKRAASVEEALDDHELVVLSLTDYDAMYAVLEPAAPALRGKVLVNLSSDTPQRAREAARWAAGHGARYLAGGMGVSPTMVGTGEGFAYYSGPDELVEEYRAALEVLSRVDYRGADPGLAPLYYQLQLDLFWSSLTGFLHAYAVAEASGVPAEEFLKYAVETAASVPGFIEFYAPRLGAGEHGGDVDRVSMAVASIEHVADTARDAGVDAGLPEALLGAFRRAADAGFAADSLTRLVGVLKK